MPNKKNNAAFDSYFFNQDVGIGLQVTIASTHSLDGDGLKNLRARLKNPNDGVAKSWLVAVIPKGQAFRYTPGPSKYALKRFYFFTLELSPPDGVLSSHTPPLTLAVS